MLFNHNNRCGTNTYICLKWELTETILKEEDAGIVLYIEKELRNQRSHIISNIVNSNALQRNLDCYYKVKNILMPTLTNSNTLYNNILAGVRTTVVKRNYKDFDPKVNDSVRGEWNRRKKNFNTVMVMAGFLTEPNLDRYILACALDRYYRKNKKAYVIIAN